jgi:hypothetical protein
MLRALTSKHGREVGPHEIVTSNLEINNNLKSWDKSNTTLYIHTNRKYARVNILRFRIPKPASHNRLLWLRSSIETIRLYHKSKHHIELHPVFVIVHIKLPVAEIAATTDRAVENQWHALTFINLDPYYSS